MPESGGIIGPATSGLRARPLPPAHPRPTAQRRTRVSVLLRVSMPQNNKMQRTSHGQNGGSPLILVFDGPNG